LYTPKYLKTLVIEEIENIGNGEDPNSSLVGMGSHPLFHVEKKSALF
jgi:hypothetical protein